MLYTAYLFCHIYIKANLICKKYFDNLQIKTLY